MTPAPRAERLRDHFVGWQCRLRADAMRRRAGRPSPGMCPQMLSAAGETLAPAVTTLLVRRESESFAPEFRHLARRSQDPRDRREAALALLAERYYQYARDFSDLLTATFAAASPLAEGLLREGRCVLWPSIRTASATHYRAPFRGSGLTIPAGRKPGGTTRSSTRNCRPTCPSSPSPPAGWTPMPIPRRRGGGCSRIGLPALIEL